MSPALTFVVPAHDAGVTLADTLGSCTNQTVAVEIVVVDDGSTDGTAEVARSFGSGRVRLVRQRNAGLAAARNAGFDEVRTELVCFLDADDAVGPEYAERMAGAIGSADLVACDWSFVGPELEDLGWRCPVLAQDGEFDRLIEVNPFSVGCIVHRAAALRELVGPFDPSLPVLEDWDLLLRLRAAGARWAEPVAGPLSGSGPLFGYRLRAGSMSGDLALMHETAVWLQAGHGLGDLERRGRDTTLRSLARAAAHERDDLVERWIAELGPLRPREVGVLAGALRIAVGRADARCPACIDRERFRLRIARLGLPEDQIDEVLQRALVGDMMRSAARRLVEFSRSARIVLLGMGRNGLGLAGELAGQGVSGRLAWIDDAPGARGPEGWRRIGFDQLERGDVVVVTPDDAQDLAARARERGVAIVVPISRLAQEATARIGISSP